MEMILDTYLTEYTWHLYVQPIQIYLRINGGLSLGVQINLNCDNNEEWQA